MNIRVKRGVIPGIEALTLRLRDYDRVVRHPQRGGICREGDVI